MVPATMSPKMDLVICGSGLCKASARTVRVQKNQYLQASVTGSLNVAIAVLEISRDDHFCNVRIQVSLVQ